MGKLISQFSKDVRVHVYAQTERFKKEMEFVETIANNCVNVDVFYKGEMFSFTQHVYPNGMIQYELSHNWSSIKHSENIESLVSDMLIKLKKTFQKD